ncbi:hypothetical protein J6590_041554 [Homalodisca vitripennis]|nr:hypothetical protein J6590_041554 [Homalodisca vitripennis]
MRSKQLRLRVCGCYGPGAAVPGVPGGQGGPTVVAAMLGGSPPGRNTARPPWPPIELPHPPPAHQATDATSRRNGDAASSLYKTLSFNSTPRPPTTIPTFNSITLNSAQNFHPVAYTSVPGRSASSGSDLQGELMKFAQIPSNQSNDSIHCSNIEFPSSISVVSDLNEIRPEIGHGTFEKYRRSGLLSLVDQRNRTRRKPYCRAFVINRKRKPSAGDFKRAQKHPVYAGLFGCRKCLDGVFVGAVYGQRRFVIVYPVAVASCAVNVDQWQTFAVRLRDTQTTIVVTWGPARNIEKYKHNTCMINPFKYYSGPEDVGRY